MVEHPLQRQILYRFDVDDTSRLRRHVEREPFGDAGLAEPLLVHGLRWERDIRGDVVDYTGRPAGRSGSRVERVSVSLDASGAAVSWPGASSRWVRAAATFVHESDRALRGDGDLEAARSRRPRTVLPMSLRMLTVAVLALVVSACASAPPTPPETLYTPPPGPGVMTGQPGSEPVTGADGGETVGTYPRPFDGWVADGDRVIVWWQTGPAPCHVLDRITVEEHVSQVTLTLYEGYAADVDPLSVDCPAQVRTVFTEVVLREAVGRRDVVDGVRGAVVDTAPVP